jgi:polysaccharide export outer membrane protein
MKFSLFFTCSAALALVGCAEDPFVGRADLKTVMQGQLPPPATVDLIAPEREYVIGPMDRVSIDVFGMPEVSRAAQIDPSGRIALPLVGVIDASGKTPGELGDEITKRLRARYVRDPQVTVNLTETVSQQVTVDGAVSKPGQYPVAGRMTLIRAIALAEGTTEFARENFVVVFRRVNNQDMAVLYDLRAIRQGIYPDPNIYANDVVSVGDSNAKRVFRTFIQSSGLLVAPLVAVLQ